MMGGQTCTFFRLQAGLFRYTLAGIPILFPFFLPAGCRIEPGAVYQAHCKQTGAA